MPHPSNSGPYAHSLKDRPKSEWEPLFTPFGKPNSSATTACTFWVDMPCPHCVSLAPAHGHLNKVAYLSSKFSKKIGFETHGFLQGLLHDLGKLSPKFQQYIKGESLSGGDHSTAGARFVSKFFEELPEVKTLGSLILQASIASHHSGLFDLVKVDGADGFEERFTNASDLLEKIKLDRFNIPKLDQEKLLAEEKSLRNFLKGENGSSFELGLFLKMFFSCLIDADRTSTIAFKERRSLAIDRDWIELVNRFENSSKELHTSQSEINDVRTQISNHVASRASEDQGMYRLTLPTGSGKTLTSLRYALKHAAKHSLEQIIYVVPYTTILDQNADEARKYLEKDEEFIVLEHHSNLTNEIRQRKKTENYDPHDKLSENWDCPIIFTTQVQFLNSFYKNGTKSVRRLHRISKSVIIFDEAQTIPVNVTHLFNRAANFLVEFCQSTLVLCTATQPNLDSLPIKKENLRFGPDCDLIEKSEYNGNVFERYNLFDHTRPSVSHEELGSAAIEKAAEYSHVLIIVNKKEDAHKLFKTIKQDLGESEIELVFLSTDLCPAHRKNRIKKIKNYTHYNSQKKLICVSTNLIESGVDLDFSIVYRVVAPLDSILQAAGRCNRHNKRPQKGEVHVVSLTEEVLGDYLKDIEIGARITRNIFHSKDQNCNSSIKITSNDIQTYFKQYYDQVNGSTIEALSRFSYPVRITDTQKDDTILRLLGANNISRNNNQEFNHGFSQAFETAGKLFEVIPAGNISVLVPFEKGSDLIVKIRNTDPDRLDWSLVRETQAYSISIYRYQFDELYKINAIETLNEEKQIYALHPSSYDAILHRGLVPTTPSLIL